VSLGSWSRIATRRRTALPTTTVQARVGATARLKRAGVSLCCRASWLDPSSFAAATPSCSTSTRSVPRLAPNSWEAWWTGPCPRSDRRRGIVGGCYSINKRQRERETEQAREWERVPWPLITKYVDYMLTPYNGFVKNLASLPTLHGRPQQCLYIYLQVFCTASSVNIIA